MSKLLIEEHPLQVLPSLAKEIGLNEAIMLQQIHYWIKDSKKIYNGKPWTYNSATKWQEQFPFWSESTIRRTVNRLKKLELITVTSEYNKMPMDNTLWYTINYDILNRVTRPPSQNDQTELSTCIDDVVNVTRAIPETSTKTSTEKNTSSDIDRLMRHHEQTWGMPNGLFLPAVQKLLASGMDAELIIHVIDNTVIKGKLWKYAAATLSRMLNEGVLTVEQAKKQNEEFYNSKRVRTTDNVKKKDERKEPARTSIDDEYKMLEELGL